MLNRFNGPNFILWVHRSLFMVKISPLLLRVLKEINQQQTVFESSAISLGHNLKSLVIQIYGSILLRLVSYHDLLHIWW